MRVAILAIATCLAPACSPAAPPPPAAATVVPLADSSADAGAKNVTTPRPPNRVFHATLRFDEKGLHARVSMRGPNAELSSLQHPRPSPARPAPAPPSANGTRLDADYELFGEVGSHEPGRAVVEPARFRITGEEAWFVPHAWLGPTAPPVEVRLTIESKDAPVVASSFGAATAVGGAGARFDKKLEVTPGALLRAIYMGGGGGRAEFDAPEGHDEAAWLGYTAFDPRATAAEVAGFRSLLNEYFFGKDPRPSSLLFFVDARDVGRFRVARHTESVFVVLGGKDPFDAPLRLAVAHELVHAWIGERLWVGDTTPGREAESYWFQEGVSRWVAREQLTRAGLLGPEELAAELNRLLGVVATSRWTERPLAELAPRRTEDGVTPLLVARGALFATAVDARLRERSKGKLSFDDVVRALMKAAEDKRVAITTDAFVSALAKELPDAPKLFEAHVTKGSERRVPDAALGACFDSQSVEFDRFEPGVDIERSMDALKIEGLDPKGPAARAGLVDGERIISILLSEKSGQVLVDTSRVTGPRRVTFAATRTPKRGQGFKKRAGLTDDACRKLFVRK